MPQVNEAAMPGLLGCREGFDSYLSCNVSAVQRLGHACVEQGVPTLIHASTSSVYGDAVGAESSPLEPISPCRAPKLAAENVLLSMPRSDGLGATILRYFSGYGPRRRPDMAYHKLGLHMLRGDVLSITGDGHQSRTNTYVSDCVSATMAALGDPRPGDVFNIGGGKELGLLDAVSILTDAPDVKSVLEFGPAPRGPAAHSGGIQPGQPSLRVAAAGCS